MKPGTGYYFLIQYCPDLARLEAANVGVVLFCAEPFYLKAKTAKGNDRIRRFFRPTNPDWARINMIKHSIEHRLTLDRDQFRDLESLKRFAATRANAMQLTAPRAIAVEDPDVELERLFDQLVGDRVRKRAAQVHYLLDRSLRTEDVAPYIRRNLKVSLPGFQGKVRVPYGFQNGRFNLIRMARFLDLNPTEIRQQAGQYAIEGDLFYRHPDPTLGDLKLIVVGQFASAQEGIASTFREVLQDNKTDLYTTQEVDRLLDVIRTTGIPVAGDSLK